MKFFSSLSLASQKYYVVLITTLTLLLLSVCTGYTNASPLENSTTPSDRLHLMNHEASSQVISLLDSIAEKLHNELQNKRGDLVDEKEHLQQRIDERNDNIADQQEIIDKTTSQVDEHQEELKQIQKELSQHEERWDDFEEKKKRFASHLALISQIRNLITGFMSLNGEECSEDRKCQDYLECDADNICRLPTGAACSKDSECLIGVNCDNGVCVSSS